MRAPQQALEALGATHVMGPNGAVPIEEFHESQRRRLEPAPAPDRPAAPPRPDRAALEAALVDAKKHRAAAADKLSRADAALQKATAVRDAARHALDQVEAEVAARAEGLADKLRAWIASGSVGERPRAKRLTPDEAARHEAAQADLTAANGAVAALEFELAEAKAADDAAAEAVADAARAIVADEASDLAAKIDALEDEAARLWHRLWAHSFAAPGGVATRLHPAALRVLNAPPRKCNRSGVPPARRTQEGVAAIEEVRAKFSELVADGPEERR